MLYDQRSMKTWIAKLLSGKLTWWRGKITIDCWFTCKKEGFVTFKLISQRVSSLSWRNHNFDPASIFTNKLLLARPVAVSETSNTCSGKCYKLLSSDLIRPTRVWPLWWLKFQIKQLIWKKTSVRHYDTWSPKVSVSTQWRVYPKKMIRKVVPIGSAWKGGTTIGHPEPIPQKIHDLVLWGRVRDTAR